MGIVPGIEKQISYKRGKEKNKTKKMDCSKTGKRK